MRLWPILASALALQCATVAAGGYEAVAAVSIGWDGEAAAAQKADRRPSPAPAPAPAAPAAPARPAPGRTYSVIGVGEIMMGSDCPDTFMDPRVTTGASA